MGDQPLDLLALLGCGVLGLAPISGLLLSDLTPVAPPQGGVCDPPPALFAVLGCGGLGLIPSLLPDLALCLGLALLFPVAPPRGGMGDPPPALFSVLGCGGLRPFLVFSSLISSFVWGLTFASLWLYEGEGVTRRLLFWSCLVVEE